MNIIKSMSGKLLCWLGNHKLRTIILGREVVRKCTRCGFNYKTGRIW